MADYFFDTSGLIKRHVDETGSRWVRSLTRAGHPHTLDIVRLTAVEMVAALTRRQRGGSLCPHQAGAILGHFRRHLINRFYVLEVNQTLLSAAMTLSRKHGLRALDAVQLAAAWEIDRQNRADGFGQVTLISADRELNAAATAEGLAVHDPSLR